MTVPQPNRALSRRCSRLLTDEQNERLTRVGPGTPMGNLFRRYWLPAALSSELTDPDGAPVRVRLLGEDLIAFRDTDGLVGLLGAFCPHRRAPMFFGRNEACGLRCVYHGWKFDRSGACVDMPSEPPDSLFKQKVGIESYPVWEGGGMVWAYLGPPGLAPPPPAYELCRTPPSHHFVSKAFEECNYLQALEGTVDPTHATILHNLDVGNKSWLRDFHATVVEVDAEKTAYGFTYAGLRQRPDVQLVRAYHYLMPSQQIRATVAGEYTIAGHVGTINGHIVVPVDDEHTFMYNYMYSHDPSEPLSLQQAMEQETRLGRGPGDLQPDFRPRRNKSNDYLIDRELQRHKTFTGIKGVNTQDFALQEGMGPIVDRSQEHLGTSDRLIILLRQLLLEGIEAMERGEAPRGADSRVARDARACDLRVPKGHSWRDAVREDMYARF
jgi:phthalate 4,5-dioxygenase